MSTSLSPLLAPMLSSGAMRAVCDDAATLQYMLDFEAALARAEARVGVIPAQAATAISAKCRAELFDPTALAEATARAGIPVIPLVKHLTALMPYMARRIVHYRLLSFTWEEIGKAMGIPVSQARNKYYYGVKASYERLLANAAKRRAEEGLI